METVVLLTVYCGLIAIMSLLGGWLPQMVQMTHLRTQLLISFVAGLMLSIATVQLLPHSIEQTQGSGWTGGAVLAGILVMFLMLRIFYVHQHLDSPLRVDPHHDHDDASPCESSRESTGDDSVGSCVVLATSPISARCGHGEHQGVFAHSRGWIGMMIGMGVHSLLDGVALAASVAADSHHGAWLGLYGLGTLVAVALHKPLDSFAIISTMRASGWSEKTRNTVNVVFAFFGPLGVVLFWLGISQLGMANWILGLGLAVSAGFFICIALADLLPEVHFHSHDRISLTAMLMAGVLLAVAIENLPGHTHDHDHDHQYPADSATDAGGQTVILRERSAGQNDSGPNQHDDHDHDVHDHDGHEHGD
jgi:zinc and cadmium transporter